MMVIANDSRSTVVAQRANRARSLWARGRGLMFVRELSEDAALIIEPCSSIHMFFMRFPLDVLYVDRSDRVVRMQEAIKPWRIGPLHTRGCRYVIELPVGAIGRSGTQIGDHLSILPMS